MHQYDALQCILKGRQEFFGSKAEYRSFPKADFNECLDYTICFSGTEGAVSNAVWQHSDQISRQKAQQILVAVEKKGLPFFWWGAPQLLGKAGHSPNPSSELSNWFVQKNMQPSGMLRGICASLDRPLLPAVSLSSIHIRRVDSQTELKQFCTLIFSLFGFSSAVIEQLYQITNRATQAGKEIHYLAYENETPVAGLTLAMGKMAGIWNMGTHPSHRHHGIGAALIQTALKEAKKREYQSIMAILMENELMRLWSQFHFQEICQFPFYIHS
ncbi:GNAT family N-acetyltransferase [Candidatus Protochlamydia phocaeensis]|uniref:GNAT family N-acetyltransferase n=1 Tax=Candidatus Protochlamydia phocaeensis TaxID=1414722 RepID=UPI00083926B2|nr:GNAT family N-acetyltransferase [Candidatus Protochlamydia phocaeensis]